MEEEGVNDIKKTLDILLEEEGLTGLKDLLRIKDAWGELAGGRLCEFTTPFKLEGGMLSVGAGSHVWVQEFGYKAEEIRKKISQDLGIDIKKIIVRKINLK